MARTVRAQQLEAADMAAERPRAVMIPAVHIVGDRPADGDETGARRHRQKPAARNEDIKDFGEQHPRLAGHHAGNCVERHQPVKTTRMQQRPAAVQANIAITAAIAIRQHPASGGNQGR